MKKRTLLFLAFLAMVLVQLYVPAQMIWGREEILNTGREYKFRTAPIDPNDPFRGKYIILRYQQNSVVVPIENPWQHGQDIYVLLKKTDPNGYVRITGISKEEPKNPESAYVKAKVDYINTQTPEAGKSTVFIAYPFDRFYLEESLAEEAEATYVETQEDSTQVAFAVVKIRKGEAVLQDVMIDSVSITDMVKARLNRPE